MARNGPNRNVAGRGPRARTSDAPVRPPRLFGLGADPIAEIEARARSIRDPVAKLRFVRRSLERYESMDERFQAVPLAPVRWALYRMSRLDRARSLFSSNPNGALNAPARAPSGGGAPGATGRELGGGAARGGGGAGGGRLPARAPRPVGAPVDGRRLPRSRRGAPAPGDRGPAPAGHLAGRLRRGLRALLQRVAHRHDLRRRRRGPGLPRVLGGRGDGVRALRPARSASSTTRPRATSGPWRSPTARSCGTRARACCAISEEGSSTTT